MKEKLNSEDSLRAQFEKDKAALNKEWEKKLKEAVAAARQEEQAKAKQEQEKIKKDFEAKLDVVQSKVKSLEGEVADLKK